MCGWPMACSTLLSGIDFSSFRESGIPDRRMYFVTAPNLLLDAPGYYKSIIRCAYCSEEEPSICILTFAYCLVHIVLMNKSIPLIIFTGRTLSVRVQIPLPEPRVKIAT